MKKCDPEKLDPPKYLYFKSFAVSREDGTDTLLVLPYYPDTPRTPILFYFKTGETPELKLDVETLGDEYSDIPSEFDRERFLGNFALPMEYKGELGGYIERYLECEGDENLARDMIKFLDENLEPHVRQTEYLKATERVGGYILQWRMVY